MGIINDSILSSRNIYTPGQELVIDTRTPITKNEPYIQVDKNSSIRQSNMFQINSTKRLRYSTLSTDTSDTLEISDELEEEEEEETQSGVFFIAKIVSINDMIVEGTTEINRWEYGWEEMTIDFVSKEAIALPKGRTGVAWNINEIVNSEFICGPSVNLLDTFYPNYISPDRVGYIDGEGTIGHIVMMFSIQDSNMDTRYVFSVENSHTGTCEVA